MTHSVISPCERHVMEEDYSTNDISQNMDSFIALVYVSSYIFLYISDNVIDIIHIM